MKGIAITFEGTEFTARPGESLAAALIAGGVRHFRETRSGACRGIFCGMGVCQECLVEIDGRPNQRACMTKVVAPISVKRSLGNPVLPLDVAQAVVIEPLHVRTPDVLVIGAGPGGLSAALAARQAGASVVVLDERSLAGGQYYKQLSVTGPDIAPPDRQHRQGAQLIAEVQASGVEMIGDALVWGAFEPGEYGVAINGHTQRWKPRATIIATGAFERGWQVPGWTLPGVMTTGAAQTLWRTARRLPGKRVLIAGNGPLNLQLAAELLAGGATVVAVVEAAAAPGLSTLPSLLRMASAVPGLMLDGVRYRLALARGRGKMIHQALVSGIEAQGESLRVSLSDAKGQALPEVFEVDCVCLGYGFEPANELLRALGCSHDYDSERRQLVTRRDARGQTDINGVFALGDCTGLGGAKAALAEGRLVGLEAAIACGFNPSGELHESGREAESELKRQRAFQKALWTLYKADAKPPAVKAAAKDGCLVCRCEEVSFATLQQALDDGISTVGAIKRHTRIGMGRCQGRYCAPLLDDKVCAMTGVQRHELSGFAPRLPVKPVTIAELAGSLEKIKQE
ncbi:FAD-dependent oxidoreductase [Pseudomonas sp. SZMC_28357]|uniref:FAD-dependent oxidoreductase n=1 Tax=Pseudomonas sp. SZMC_28357 TaxID=3074380 RepID=UPI002871A074|nr:FAD-dependent oxidoreductase [Pseudomonas sp. SZMC_28357]MDR9751468.1 FAD-dependent oxidoreductase [Pseudomonas sp. SZMC_28357]